MNRCWTVDPEERPSMEQVLVELNGMREKLPALQQAERSNGLQVSDGFSAEASSLPEQLQSSPTPSLELPKKLVANQARTSARREVHMLDPLFAGLNDPDLPTLPQTSATIQSKATHEDEPSGQKGQVETVESCNQEASSQPGLPVGSTQHAIASTPLGAKKASVLEPPRSLLCSTPATNVIQANQSTVSEIPTPVLVAGGAPSMPGLESATSGLQISQQTTYDPLPPPPKKPPDPGIITGAMPSIAEEEVCDGNAVMDKPKVASIESEDPFCDPVAAREQSPSLSVSEEIWTVGTRNSRASGGLARGITDDLKTDFESLGISSKELTAKLAETEEKKSSDEEASDSSELWMGRKLTERQIRVEPKGTTL